ncbi:MULTISPECIES: hypothetical protein [unclassified Bradyrhizobium]|uniref:hypothetical protein n=1 Tax=unclassified Bradyrhizobium TaxID=2631580 RepID=UPI0004091105|nr:MULTISPECIES: hypothetical protein [unclassified Bradyrhizobium]QIG91531.1 hypothetical protein G6P99_02725 [Bradyrhizobium sp. 6(2017)]
MTAFEINRDASVASHAEPAFRGNDQPIHKDYWLDVALEDSFPCSDPISSMRAD